MAQYLVDLLSSLASCMCCFSGTPRLKIKNRSFRILRLLGEVRALHSLEHLG